MTNTVVATLDARSYEDHDDCLAAALADTAADLGLESWELEAHWADDARDEIVVVKTSKSLVGDLCDYETGDRLRDATWQETKASVEAAKRDGGAGVIRVDGRSCYVSETRWA